MSSFTAQAVSAIAFAPKPRPLCKIVRPQVSFSKSWKASRNG
jgi:hypothetical protein